MDKTEHTRRKQAFKAISKANKERKRRIRPKMRIRERYTKSALVRLFRRAKCLDTLQAMRERREREAVNLFEEIEVQRASDHRADEILTGQYLPVRWDTARYDIVPN
jgi:hypothetical protein